MKQANVPEKPASRAYSLGEEIANAVTHGISTLAAIAATPLLVLAALRTGDPLTIAAYSVFAASLILLYLMSTLYHSIVPSFAKRVFRIFDHSSIYILIAGTYTVFTLTVIRGTLGFALLGTVWGIGVLGILLFAVFGQKVNKLSVILYLVDGWAVVFAFAPLKAALPLVSLRLLVCGGLAYTLGTILYAMKRVPWTHPIWHLFVTAGSVFHVFSALTALG